MKFNSVKERILVAFFVYSTISFAVSTTSFFLFRDLESVDNATSEVNRLYNQILDGLRIGQQFFAYEMNDENFYLTGSSASIANHEEIIANALETIAQIKNEKGAEILEMTNDLERLELQLTDYKKKYEKSWLLVKEKGFKDQGLIGEMRRQIREVESTLINERELILSLRRNEKDYLLRGDTAYVFQVVSLTTELRDKIFASNNFSDFKKTRLTSLLNRYYKNLIKIVEIDQELGFQSSVSGIAPTLKANIREISERIQAVNKRAIKKKFAINTRVQLILVSIVTLSIILTLFLSLSFKFVLGDDVEAV